MGTGWEGRPRAVGERREGLYPLCRVFLSWHLEKAGVLCVCVVPISGNRMKEKLVFKGISAQFQPGARGWFTEVVGIWKRAPGTGHNFNP